MPHQEHHHTHRSGWLRAAVLGANDGIISTASLLLGTAAAHATHDYVLLAGIAGLAAGTLAMAAGEYVSVSSQADTEAADLAIGRRGLSEDREEEHEELAAIYVRRGLAPDLAQEVARQLMAHDALAAHARDELGISESLRARPLQAALSSGTSFISGALIPLTHRVPTTSLLQWSETISSLCVTGISRRSTDRRVLRKSRLFRQDYTGITPDSSSALTVVNGGKRVSRVARHAQK